MQLQNHSALKTVFDKPQEIFIVFSYEIETVVGDFATLAYEIIEPFFKVNFRN